MSKILYFILSELFFLFICQFSIAENPIAFPGAEGFGRYTTGGRGGSVYHVSNLADDGSAGTLRSVLNIPGNRTIVFDISGTIHLKSPLSILSANVTIAGQTAPGDGICIADYPFTINASNVIIRFIRFRLGNIFVAYHEGDGLGGMDQQNIMVDHCSVSWSIDECLSVYGMKNCTVQWCLVSQSLRNSGHSKGAHGYGGNWGGSGASYHHNLLCHHDSRTPRLGPRPTTQLDERMDMRNNVIYNWAGNGCYGGEGMSVNILNNYYKPGPRTKQKSTAIQYRIASIGIRTTSYVATYPAFAPMLHVWGNFYANGNFINGFPAVTTDNWTNGIYAQISNTNNDNLFTQTTKDTMKLVSPIDFIYTTTHTPEIAYEKVLKYAGASLSRDWVDSLMVYDARNGVASHTGTGSGDVLGIIDSQNDNKPANAPANWDPWPVLLSSLCPMDTDRDGMPDNWEIANGLNPTDSTDGNIKNADGFTMLEVYMNSLVSTIINDGIEGGTGLGTKMGEIINPTPVSQVTLSQTTYSGAAGAASPWTFNNGYSITNNNSKTYSSGSESGVKYSTGVQYRVNLPAGIAVDSVRFVGYNNFTGTDSYLSELNGNIFGNTDYVFTAKDATGNYSICSRIIPMATPVKGSFTFTFNVNQVVLQIILSVRMQTKTENVFISPLDPNLPINVYWPDGRIFRSNVRRCNAKVGLPRGIYIIDKQKYVLLDNHK